MANLTRTYTLEIEGQKAVATVGQLKDEIQRLEANMENLALGSKELEEAMINLGRAKGTLKELDDAVDALDPKMKVAAFMDFAGGVTGAFGVATVAANSFGLSSGTVGKMEEKLQSLLVVMSSFQSISTALNSETLANVKSMMGFGNSFTIAGIKAKLAGLTIRQAMIATGVGALVVIVGTLIANFDKVKAVGMEIYKNFKPQFDAVGQIIDNLVAKARDLASAVTFGLVDDAKTAAKKAAEDIEVEETKRRIASRARRIKELEALGKDTFALRRKNLEEELSIMKRETDEEKAAFNEKATELRALRNAEKKRMADERKKDAEEAEKAAKEANEKVKRAQEKAFGEFLERSKSTTELLGRTVREQMAIEAELQKEMLEKNAEELARLFPNALKEITGGGEEAPKVPAPSLKDTFLAKIMGINPEAYMAMKEEMDAALNDLGQSAFALTDSFLQDALGRADSQIAYFDEKILQAQERMAEIDQELQDRASNLESLEDQAMNARGARREYLLSKIESERKAEAALRKERAAAAAEEAKAAAKKEQAEKRRQELELVGQKITAATTAVESVLAAVEAARAIAKTTSGGKMGWDNIALAIGATAALVAGFTAVKNAVKLADGGEIQGGSHASGNDVPVFGGRVRVEGGEYITNKYSTANNRAAIERINREGRNTHFTAVPTSTVRRMAEGGQLPGGNQPAPAGGMDSTGVLLTIANNTEAIANYTRMEAMKPARAYNFRDAQEIKAIQENEARAESLAKL